MSDEIGTVYPSDEEVRAANAIDGLKRFQWQKRNGANWVTIAGGTTEILVHWQAPDPNGVYRRLCWPADERSPPHADIFYRS